MAIARYFWVPEVGCKDKCQKSGEEILGSKLWALVHSSRHDICTGLPIVQNFIYMNAGAYYVIACPTLSTLSTFKVSEALLKAILQSENPNVRVVSVPSRILSTEIYEKGTLSQKPRISF